MKQPISPFFKDHGLTKKQMAFATRDTMTQGHKTFVQTENKKGELSPKLQSIVKKGVNYAKDTGFKLQDRQGNGFGKVLPANQGDNFGKFIKC